MVLHSTGEMHDLLHSMVDTWDNEIVKRIDFYTGQTITVRQQIGALVVLVEEAEQLLDSLRSMLNSREWPAAV